MSSPVAADRRDPRKWCDFKTSRRNAPIASPPTRKSANGSVTNSGLRFISPTLTGSGFPTVGGLEARWLRHSRQQGSLETGLPLRQSRRERRLRPVFARRRREGRRRRRRRGHQQLESRRISMCSRQRGFTLVEILVVVMIIGLMMVGVTICHGHGAWRPRAGNRARPHTRAVGSPA